MCVVSQSLKATITDVPAVDIPLLDVKQMQDLAESTRRPVEDDVRH